MQTNGAYFLNFNGWVTGVINPDGTDLTGFHGGIGDNQQYMMYGASFTPTFDPVINYFPENILLHEGGFGGIIKHPRGLGKGTHLAGYTIYKDSLLNYPSNTPEEYRHYYSKVGYACDPDVLPDGKIIFSWAPNYKQDYGVYVMNADGTNRKLIYNTGGAQLRAKAIRSRPVPPKIADKVTSYPSMYPPLESAPYNIDGNFTFNCLNVYTNGNVDEEITTGVPFGDAGSIKFFINHQRTRKNSNPEQDFPIQLAEVTIPASGKIVKTNLPADQPLFEQLRTPSSKGYVVPSTGAPYPNSTAHVAGMNYGRPGETVTCVGCHRGHSMLPIPSAADAPYTNIAPGAAVTVSNTANAYFINFINDRKAQKAFAEGDYWITQLNLITSEWVRFGYDIPAKIRSVRIFNIPAGGVGNSSLQITKVQVRVYANKNATGSYTQVIFNQVISPNGTNLLMGNNAIGKCVEVKILAISGTYNGFPRTGLAEIEVIGSGDLSAPRQAEVDQPISMQVFPNPVKDFVTVTVNEAEPNTSCIIFNSKGEVVLSKIMNGEQSINENIDMREFANGIYFIQIASASGKTVTKIVKTGF
ncbi:MAG: T9SS type A sorting domain-containing protein [Bacteroidetes bacterium]|nr:T9SS type A sorting domain-containing protein [Bacteroidota bacterium]